MRTDEAPAQCFDPSHPRQVDLSKPVCATQTAPVLPLAPDSEKYFNRAWVDGQIGRVGYHMTARLQIMKGDEPPGCSPSLDSWAIQGDLPPGIIANFSNGSFEGTPRQPGEWNIPLVLRGIRCSNARETYGDRQTNLHFRIDP
jgi:hypothetical protein